MVASVSGVTYWPNGEDDPDSIAITQSRRPDKTTDEERYMMWKAHCDFRKYNCHTRSTNFQAIEVDEKDSVRSIRRRAITLDELPGWLREVESTIYSSPEPNDVSPVLRLLVDIQTEDYKDTTDYMYFSDRVLHSQMIECLNLPRTYGYSAITDSQVFTTALTEDKRRIKHLLLQTSDSAPLAATLALGYAPQSGCLSGYLEMIHPTPKRIDELEYFLAHVDNPLLIPIIILEDLVNSAYRGLFGLEPSMVEEIYHATESLAQTFTENEIQRKLLIFRKVLYKLSFQFPAKCLREIDEIMRGSYHQSGPKCMELNGLVGSLRLQLHDLIETIDLTMRQVDVYLQTAYSQMQGKAMKQAREDAKLALRDSAQMKAIAVLTMVFLPGTALATIFSMDPFFTVSDDNKLVVSSHFWIFWAIAVPVTFVVVLIYFIWIQRAEVRNPWAKSEISDTSPQYCRKSLSSSSLISMKEVHTSTRPKINHASSAASQDYIAPLRYRQGSHMSKGSASRSEKRPQSLRDLISRECIRNRKEVDSNDFVRGYTVNEV